MKINLETQSHPKSQLVLFLFLFVFLFFALVLYKLFANDFEVLVKLAKEVGLATVCGLRGNLRLVILVV